MEKKDKSRSGLWILVLVILIGAGLAAYFVFSKPADAPPEAPPPASDQEQAPGLERQSVPAEGEPSSAPAKEGNAVEEESQAAAGGFKTSEGEEPDPKEREQVPAEERPAGADQSDDAAGTSTAASGEAPAAERLKDDCAQLEQDVRDFFAYLDGKDYVQAVTGGGDTWPIFVRTLSKLSARPPVPAGEGLDPTVMTANIFHLFRVLDDREIQLAREVIRHESDTLEFNLDTFYTWLTLGERCPDPEGIRPTEEVLYRYAGFFMNTIGGRSYLFRRTTRLRLLISYYAVCILHDADREGRNTFGIDVFPLVEQVSEDISLYGGYHFQQAYLERLGAMEGYYRGRR